jgi:hypothetical protein
MHCLAALLLLAALAAAPARAVESQIAALAGADPAVARACAAALAAPPADQIASYNACWGPLEHTDPPPVACPSPECAAFAATAGAGCLKAFYGASVALYGRAAAALAGGPAMPAAAAEALQRLVDAKVADNPGDVPPVDLVAKLGAGDAALAAEWESQAAFYEAFAVACAPDAAEAAPARGDSILKAKAALFADATPSCAGLLDPPSAELEAADLACWGPLNAAADAPPATCPSPECEALAAAMGAACFAEFNVASVPAYAAAAAALTGGPALPAAEAAKLQALRDAVLAASPAINTPTDLAAALESGDAALAADFTARAAYLEAIAAACAPEAAAAAAEAASGGVRAAVAAAAAAAALLPLLAL